MRGPGAAIRPSGLARAADGPALLRLELSSSRSRQAIDITHLFTSRTWPDGLLLVSVEHTTAALFLGESGSEMFEDYERVAARLVAEPRALPARDVEPRQRAGARPLQLPGHAAAAARERRPPGPGHLAARHLPGARRASAALHRRGQPGDAAAGLRDIRSARLLPGLDRCPNRTDRMGEQEAGLGGAEPSGLGGIALCDPPAPQACRRLLPALSGASASQTLARPRAIGDRRSTAEATLPVRSFWGTGGHWRAPSPLPRPASARPRAPRARLLSGRCCPAATGRSRSRSPAPRAGHR